MTFKKKINNEVNSYKILFETYKDKVYKVAYYIVKNEQDAKDIVQESFIIAYEKMDSLKDPSKFESWICRIASNLAKHKYMKNKRELLVEDDHKIILLSNLREDFHSIEDQIEMEELSEEILEQIHRLNDHYREVLLLYYYMDLSYTEISKVLEIKEGTVKSRLSRAKNLLRIKIEKSSKENHYSTREGFGR